MINTKKISIQSFFILLGIFTMINTSKAQDTFFVQTSITQATFELNHYNIEQEQLPISSKSVYYATWTPNTNQFPIRIINENGKLYIRCTINDRVFELNWAQNENELGKNRFFAVWKTGIFLGHFPVTRIANSSDEMNFQAIINHKTYQLNLVSPISNNPKMPNNGKIAVWSPAIKTVNLQLIPKNKPENASPTTYPLDIEKLAANQYLTENFSNNTNKWLIQDDEYAKVDIKDGQLNISSKIGNMVKIGISKIFDINRDFIISTKIRHVSGVHFSGYGLFLDGENDGSRYSQVFQISANGRYSVQLQDRNSVIVNKKLLSSSYIKKDNNDYNYLQIMKKGNTIEFYINGGMVYQMDFITFTMYKIGFTITGLQTIAVDHLKIGYL